MASRNYKYYQPNDKDLKDQYGDCVVRALTKVMSKTWMQVFDDLISYAKKLQCMVNRGRIRKREDHSGIRKNIKILQ